VKKQIQLVILLFSGLGFLVSLIPLFADAAKFQSGVTINEAAPPQPVIGTCGLEIISGVPINYGQLNIGQLSAEQKITYKNAGNATAQIMVKASDWIGGTSANPIKMGVAEITRVAETPGKDFGNKLPLRTYEIMLGELGPGQTGQSYWSLYADNGLSGSPHQDVTLDLTC
jgi:hypothetical protein